MKRILLAITALLFLQPVSSDHAAAAPQPDAAPRDGVRLLRTAPTTRGETREERERNFRSCLFTFLPRIGSDAAAEMIRDACRDEYLH